MHLHRSTAYLITPCTVHSLFPSEYSTQCISLAVARSPITFISSAIMYQSNTTESTFTNYSSLIKMLARISNRRSNSRGECNTSHLEVFLFLILAQLSEFSNPTLCSSFHFHAARLSSMPFLRFGINSRSLQQR